MMDHIRSTYGVVKTWDDLIGTNLSFLKGQLHSTFYREEGFYDDCYREGTYKIEEDLIRLNQEYGLFTYESQTSLYRPHKRQRGYVSFVCPKDEPLVQRLLADQRIYTFAHEENSDGSGSIQHNCLPQIVLAEPTGPIFNLSKYEDMQPKLLELTDDLPKIRTQLLDTHHVFICMRDFPTRDEEPTEATTCLIEALDRY